LLCENNRKFRGGGAVQSALVDGAHAVSLTWPIVIGAFFSFCLASGFCSVDLYQTISQSDLQVSAPYKSFPILAFVLLNAVFAVGFFVVTCFYPGEWISKTVGLDVENPIMRDLAVGATVTAIVRSKFLNLANNSGFGLDAAYSTLREFSLARLHIDTTLKVAHLAVNYQNKILACPRHSTVAFNGHLVAVAEDLLRSRYSGDPPRRDRILEQFAKQTVALATLPVSDLSPEGLAIKLAMSFCGINDICKDLDNWIIRKTESALGAAS
jgi:hypothetical protein